MKRIDFRNESADKITHTSAINTVPIQIKLLSDRARIPTPAKPGDAGLDLCAVDTVVNILPNHRIILATEIAVAIPEGYAGFVLPRSGCVINQGITVANSPGLIDSGYRGEIKIVLINHSSSPVHILRGDRIAQLVILPVPTVEFQQVEELPPSERGEGGFGSTGA